MEEARGKALTGAISLGEEMGWLARLDMRGGEKGGEEGQRGSLVAEGRIRRSLHLAVPEPQILGDILRIEAWCQRL